jgi:hypothetical protein
MDITATIIELRLAADLLAGIASDVEDRTADPAALFDTYAAVLEARANMTDWVINRQGFEPRDYRAALDEAGNALNAADDAHYLVTRTWVPLSA